MNLFTARANFPKVVLHVSLPLKSCSIRHAYVLHPPSCPLPRSRHNNKFDLELERSLKASEDCASRNLRRRRRQQCKFWSPLKVQRQGTLTVHAYDACGKRPKDRMGGDVFWDILVGGIGDTWSQDDVKPKAWETDDGLQTLYVKNNCIRIVGDNLGYVANDKAPICQFATRVQAAAFVHRNAL